MGTIIFKEISDGDIEPCRQLCNELMAYQRSKAFREKERFDAMNFDTRMRKSFETALRKQVVVAYGGDVPVGYVFSTVDTLEDMGRSPFRLLPQGAELPGLIGCLSNIYLREAYRSTGIGKGLFDMAIGWFDGMDDVHLIYIFISNGNDEAYRFYLRNGFFFSHDVMGGFIKAVGKRK